MPWCLLHSKTKPFPLELPIAILSISNICVTSTPAIAKRMPYFVALVALLGALGHVSKQLPKQSAGGKLHLILIDTTSDIENDSILSILRVKIDTPSVLRKDSSDKKMGSIRLLNMHSRDKDVALNPAASVYLMLLVDWLMLLRIVCAASLLISGAKQLSAARHVCLHYQRFYKGTIAWLKRAFKRVNTFKGFRTELVEGKEKRASVTPSNLGSNGMLNIRGRYFIDQ
ncbi:hypothetical protein Tco_0447725 [Tanacetum coccineum]